MSGVEPELIALRSGLEPPPAQGALPLEYYAPDLESVICTASLRGRPVRAADHASESRALVTLAQAMAAAPGSILQTLADVALTLCQAQSAGISLLSRDRKTFYWPAVAGQWASYVGGGTPRDFGPCGTVLDRNSALMFSHPERHFTYLGSATPSIEECLLIPFYLEGEAIGTIWVVAHDYSRRFDAEDLRLITNLATFATAAYQSSLSANVTQRIASIVESSEDAIYSGSLDGLIITWNRGAERLFGYTIEEIINQEITILIPPSLQEAERNIILRVRRGEHINHYETIRRHKDGTLIPISLTASPIANVSGKIIGVSKIARNISAQKQKEERIALLAHEVDHRSKNLLTLVQATVQLAKGDTPDALKTTIIGRIRALANAHTLLAESCWAGADLRRLIMEELSPYCLGGELRAELIGQSVSLKSRSAQSIAIVLHELTTNAVKYGALSVGAGRVRVEWSTEAGGHLILIWTETNGPPITPPSRHGFGTRVIERIMKGELKGEARFQWHGRGLVCELSFDPAIEV